MQPPRGTSPKKLWSWRPDAKNKFQDCMPPKLEMDTFLARQQCPHDAFPNKGRVLAFTPPKKNQENLTDKGMPTRITMVALEIRGKIWRQGPKNSSHKEWIDWKALRTREERCRAHTNCLTSMIRKGVGSNKTSLAVKDVCPIPNYLNIINFLLYLLLVLLAPIAYRTQSVPKPPPETSNLPTSLQSSTCTPAILLAFTEPFGAHFNVQIVSFNIQEKFKDFITFQYLHQIL